jgi:CMP-N-acetylneuraminic acid synthetase
MRNICLIPARGGSKRVPRKNIVDFYGKPLLSYTVEAAIQSRLFGRHIYVSSDSAPILNIARQYSSQGVQAIERPEGISGDTATLEDAAIHLLKSIDLPFDHLCVLMPNFPLRIASDIRASYRTFLRKREDCLMTTTEFNWLTPFWAMQERDGLIHFFFGRKYLVDSKSLPKNIVALADAVRWVRVSSFLKERKFHGKRVSMHLIPFERSIEIDDYKNLDLARKLFPLVYPDASED